MPNRIRITAGGMLRLRAEPPRAAEMKKKTRPGRFVLAAPWSI
jgi:hypothetical protein